MKVLIASSKPDEIRGVLENAGFTVDTIAPDQLNIASQKDYDFVVLDAAPAGELLKNGNIELDAEKHIIRRNKRTIKATPLEFKIIAFFLEHRGKIVSKNDLAVGCWDDPSKVSYNTIEVYIKRIRAKLGASSIRTLHGIGYQMDKK